MFRVPIQGRNATSTPPPASEDEACDMLNNDTFGVDVMEGEFDFRRMNLRVVEHETTISKNVPLIFDSKVTIVHNEVSEFEELPPGMMSPIVIIPPQSRAITATSQSGGGGALTLAEIEAKLSQSSLLKYESNMDCQWYPIKSSRPAIITFPTSKQENFDEEVSTTGGGEVDPRRDIMTRFEREGISRIHLGQLTTEHPEMEDFYYRAYAKKLARRRTQNVDTPLYLPLPTPRRQQQKNKGVNDRSINEALAGALGKVSASSARKPRQLLQVPTCAKIILASSSNVTGEVQISIASSVERIFESVLKVEDALTQESDTEYDLKHLQECRRMAIQVITKELSLDRNVDDLSSDETILSRFLNLLGLSRTKKILGRAIRAIDSTNLSDSLLTRLIEFFEYLDVGRHEAPEKEMELFINSILAALVPYVAKSPIENVIAKVELLCNKEGLPWIITNKAGIVLSCILLSRLEILKSSGGGNNSETETLKHAQLAALFESIFDQIQERLADIFTNLHNADTEFYGWQLMALLALNVDADRKRIMVMDLRDRILSVVQRGDTKAVANLNIFLNALGLDASQLGV